MAFQPVEHVLARTQHARGLPELPGMVSAPGEDIAGAMGTAARDAGIATGQVRFATVKTVPPGQQVDLRADGEIVMHGDIEGHVQPVDQRLDVHVHGQQMVDMHPRHVHRPQQQDQIVQAFGGKRQ